MAADTSLARLTLEQIESLDDDMLAEYEAELEALYWARGKESFREFCTRVEVPGVPTSAAEDDFFPTHVEPAAHHDLIIDAVQKLADGRYHDVDGVLIHCPPGSAKALALETPIPTPMGWTTIGELRVGDAVFDDMGRPCYVTWVSPVWKDRPVYKVTTDCGDEIIADEDHEWRVCLCRKHGGFSIKETKELARRRSKRPMIERARPLWLPVDANLPIDPYTLGVWLGDGNSSGGGLTLNSDDAPHIVHRIRSAGLHVEKNKATLNWCVHGIRGELARLGLLRDVFRNIVGDKRIPSAYLRGSHNQRLALLQGLIDTDGHINKSGMVCFSSTRLALADGVAELVRSLGAKASIHEARAILNGKDCGPYWRVNFFLAAAASVPRKAKNAKDGTRTPNTYIDVERLPGKMDTICIEVDSPSHLFLCGRSMTPTHNSTYSSVLAPAWLLGRKAGTNVIATSYGDELAQKFGRRVRHIVRSREFERIMGCSITGDNQAVNDWSVTNGSEYRASGVQGTITGIRADFLIMDDPVKNREEADSETIRDKLWEAYLDNCQSRLKPGGKILLIMTRWHENDIAGRLLGEKWKGQSGLWRATDGRLFLIINLPLLAEHKDDPLGRKPGELLWPSWFRMEDAKRLQENAKKGGSFARTWSSLYQQRPSPNEGAILSKSYWREWTGKELPECDQIYLCYDTAFEEDEEADYSAMTAWGVFDHTSRKKTGEEYAHKHVILLGAWEDKVSAVDLIDIVQGHCKLFRPDRILVEKRASGIQLVQEMKRRRLPVQDWLPRGKPGTKGKVPRAHAVAAILEMGSVWYVPGEKTERVLEQCAAFPYGTNDDLCLVAGTIIATKRGLIPIEDVRVGDLALTPVGWRPVSAAGFTGIRPVVSRAGITGTGNHPVFTLDGGFVPLEMVNSIVTVSRTGLWNLIRTIRREPWSSMACATPSWAGSEDIISQRQREMQSASGPRGSMLPFGSTITAGLFRRSMRCTIRTAILLTAALRIWSAYRALCIVACITKARRTTQSLTSSLRTWLASGQPLLSGIGRMKAESGIGRMLFDQANSSQGPRAIRSSRSRQLLAQFAGLFSKGSTFGRSCAPTSATICGGGERAGQVHAASSLGCGLATCAGRSSSIATAENLHALKSATEQSVYNLTVDGAHAYYANGVLVHNCDTVTMALSFFRDAWIFRTAEDELDEDELKDVLLARSDSRRHKRSLYSGPVGKARIDLDADDIERMSADTRRRLYG